jgi:hypothetical protein
MDLKFLPEKNRENAKELLTKCKKACKVLKKCVNNPSEFEKTLKELQSEIVSVLHYYCLECDKNIDKTQKKESDFYRILLNALSSIFYKPFKGTVTLTYGDVAESHAGMQNIGTKASKGFSYEDILKAQRFFTEKGCETLIVHLNDFLPDVKDVADKEERAHLEIAKTSPEFQAYLLVVRGGLRGLVGDDKGVNLTTETQFFEWDTKLYNTRRKIVQNKNARYNLNFSNEKQHSDFEKGKGTTVPWEEVPLIYNVRKELYKAFGKSAKNLQCEGNLYYEPNKSTGIGYHGDTERRKVIGVRLGKRMNIHYMWYYNDRPRAVNVSLILEPGDIYCMSEKTVGTDWRPCKEEGWLKKRYTLRHAAGAEKYTTKTGKIDIINRRPTAIPQYKDIITVGDIVYKEKKKSGKKSKTKDEESEESEEDESDEEI